MSAVVLFADSHLQESAWSSGVIRGDSKFALIQIISYAIRVGAAAVIGAGDLIDQQRNRAGPPAFLFGQIDRLQEKKIPFYFIQGDHDDDRPAWPSGHRWSYLLHRQCVLIDGVTFYGLDCLPRGELQDELDQIPAEADVLVAHQRWADFMGEVTSPQGQIADVPVVSHVFTGDFHQYMHVKKLGKDGQEVIVCSPGSTCLQEISEPTDKYFVTFDTVKKKFYRVPLKTRVLIDWPVMNRPEDVAAFVDEIDASLAAAAQKAAAQELPDELVRPLLRVTYGSRLTDVVRRVERAVSGRAHLFWKELPPPEKTAAAAGPNRVAGGAAVTPLSVLPRLVNKDESPAVYDLCDKLLTAVEAGADAGDVLASWRAEELGEADGS